ncbi:MAG: hypothetical protein KDA21_02975, partial [Phycisphaerales bacterium]|nr:hypothetical protein [Phycisphaerales bacterium]
HAEGEQLARKAIVLDLGDLQRQADWLKEQAEKAAATYIEEARAERERILAGAHEEGFEKGRREGHEAGYAAGLEEGRAAAFTQAGAELARTGEAWDAALDAFESRRTALLTDAREDLLRLALLIAGRIVHRHIEADPRVVLDQVEALIGMTMGPTRLVIEINPADRPVLEQALPGLIRRLGRTVDTEVVSDDEVKRGGCRVRTSRGVLDADIDVQMQRMVEALLPGRGPDAPGGERA